MGKGEGGVMMLKRLLSGVSSRLYIRRSNLSGDDIERLQNMDFSSIESYQDYVDYYNVVSKGRHDLGRRNPTENP